MLYRIISWHDIDNLFKHGLLYAILENNIVIAIKDVCHYIDSPVLIPFLDCSDITSCVNVTQEHVSKVT